MRDDEIFTAAEKERIFNATWTACGKDYQSFEPLHPSTQRFLDLLEECKALSLAKSADYGRDDDPDANLKNGHAFGIPNWIAVTCRMDDKLSRIKTAARQRLSTGEIHLQNEGLIDSLRDLAVYALKAIVRIEEEGT